MTTIQRLSTATSPLLTNKAEQLYIDTAAKPTAGAYRSSDALRPTKPVSQRAPSEKGAVRNATQQTAQSHVERGAEMESQMVDYNPAIEHVERIDPEIGVSKKVLGNEFEGDVIIIVQRDGHLNYEVTFDCAPCFSAGTVQYYHRKWAVLAKRHEPVALKLSVTSMVAGVYLDASQRPDPECPRKVRDHLLVGRLGLLTKEPQQVACALSLVERECPCLLCHPTGRVWDILFSEHPIKEFEWVRTVFRKHMINLDYNALSYLLVHSKNGPRSERDVLAILLCVAQYLSASRDCNVANASRFVTTSIQAFDALACAHNDPVQALKTQPNRKIVELVNRAFRKHEDQGLRHKVVDAMRLAAEEVCKG